MLSEGQEILDKRYKVISKVGNGAFGDIYKVEKKRNGEFYAAKVEKAQPKQKSVMLFWESKLIHKLRGKTQIPNLHFVGDEKTADNKVYHVMVMDLLGKSLENLFEDCHRKFDLGTVLHIAVQLISIIQKVHEERIIHRDIKPDNFLIGSADHNKNLIFIVDFGLAKCYKNSQGEHIPFIDKKNLTGTARYVSVNTHLGYEQSRRDDLETIGHVLLYFLRGSLPWQGLPGRTKNEKYSNIKKKKLEVSIEELCQGHPEEFAEYMHYCRKLEFKEDPDYRYIRNLFVGCMRKNGIDIKTPEFIWNQNRLKLQKDELKRQMLKAIKAPVKAAHAPENETKDEEQKKVINKNSIAITQANAILQKRKEEDSRVPKATKLAGQNIVAGGTKIAQIGESMGVSNSQLQNQQHGYYGERS